MAAAIVAKASGPDRIPMAIIVIDGALLIVILFSETRFSWAMISLALFGFAGYNAQQVVNGSDCKCFGDLPASSEFLAILELLSAFLFLLNFIYYKPVQIPRIVLLGFVLVFVGIVFAGGLVAIESGVTGHREFARVRLEVGDSIESIPTEPPELLGEGNWVVVLYREQCGKCLQFISDFVESGGQSPLEARRVAFIEISGSCEHGDLIHEGVYWGRSTVAVRGVDHVPACFICERGIIVNIESAEY